MATGTQLEKSALVTPGQPQVTDRLSALWTLGRVRWAGMQPAQRNWAVVAALLICALAGGLLWYAVRPDWRTLYANLEPEDARPDYLRADAGWGGNSGSGGAIG
jgi:flagellar M-ring protein FliF